MQPFDEVPLVALVDDDVGDAFQRPVALQTPQHHARGAHEDLRARGLLALEADRVACELPRGAVHLVGDALRDADGADPPRLRHQDVDGASLAPLDPVLHNVLRHLRGLPAARLALDDDDLVVADLLHHLLPQCERREPLPGLPQRLLGREDPELRGLERCSFASSCIDAVRKNKIVCFVVS